jgi:protein-S-isoprenylcysteine O-methyltransferase Ste14
VALREEFARSGAMLFRWRSYLPLLTLPLYVWALSRFSTRTADETLGASWDLFCIAVAFAGLAVRAVTVGQVPHRTSGRNTLEQVADSLNTAGMYSVVRHPLYVGNFLTWLGIAMFPQSWLVVLVSVMAFALYYERIMFAEEQFLREKFRDQFRTWADRTPAFFPRFSQWRASPVPFSVKRVLRREYSGFFAIVVTFTAFAGIREWFERGWLRLGPAWLAFLAAGVVVYVGLRYAKKSGKLPAH